MTRLKWGGHLIENFRDKWLADFFLNDKPNKFQQKFEIDYFVNYK